MCSVRKRWAEIILKIYAILNNFSWHFIYFYLLLLHKRNSNGCVSKFCLLFSIFRSFWRSYFWPPFSIERNLQSTRNDNVKEMGNWMICWLRSTPWFTLTFQHIEIYEEYANHVEVQLLIHVLFRVQVFFFIRSLLSPRQTECRISTINHLTTEMNYFACKDLIFECKLLSMLMSMCARVWALISTEAEQKYVRFSKFHFVVIGTRIFDACQRQHEILKTTEIASRNDEGKWSWCN